MALYLGAQKIAGNGSGSGGSGSGTAHVYLTQERYDELSAAGSLSSDAVYMTPGAGGGLALDEQPTEGSSNAAKSGGIWSFVKGLLPSWLTSSYAEPQAALDQTQLSAVNSGITAALCSQEAADESFKRAVVMTESEFGAAGFTPTEGVIYFLTES